MVFDEGAGRWREQDRVYEVFDPPWWRVDEWARWFWATRVRKVARGTVLLTDGRTGRSRSYRTFVPAPPRSLPVVRRVREKLGL